jgi:hypothetical protein
MGVIRGVTMLEALLSSFTIVMCLLAGALAARKGYNFFCWVFAGGILGLVALAFLPYVSTQSMPELEARGRIQTGNSIGIIISAFAVLPILVQLLVLFKLTLNAFA